MLNQDCPQTRLKRNGADGERLSPKGNKYENDRSRMVVLFGSPVPLMQEGRKKERERKKDGRTEKQDENKSRTHSRAQK